MSDIGPLTAADEFLYHQFPDTFAVTATSDRNWTERIWLTAFAKDGSLQANFGLGKYTNRNVLDGFAGVSRGPEQFTVRASRELFPDPLTTSAGPWRYEVVEPLKAVRVVLEPNDVVPISYDVTFHAVFPALFEKRNRHRSGYRLAEDTVRYHQMGTASGWIEIDGERTELAEGEWGAARDHSWGERGERLVGGAAPGTEPTKVVAGAGGRNLALWSPLLLTRPDGSRYEIQMYLIDGAHRDGPQRFVSGHLTEEDGSRRAITVIDPKLTFATDTRYLTGGHYRIVLEDGEERLIEIEPQGASGFHLRTGRYGMWKGAMHGHWLGPLVVDGEHLPSCAEAIRQVGQSRDKPVLVRDGDATGYGIQESIVSGAWPEFGLGTEADYGRGEGAGPEDC